MQNTSYFVNDETGSSFLQRNEHLSIAPSKEKSGKLFFIASTDGVGAVSDNAAEFLKAEMAKPNADLKQAICMLNVGTIAGTDIKCLHKVGQPSSTLWSI